MKREKKQMFGLLVFFLLNILFNELSFPQCVCCGLLPNHSLKIVWLYNVQSKKKKSIEKKITIQWSFVEYIWLCIFLFQGVLCSKHGVQFMITPVTMSFVRSASSVCVCVWGSVWWWWNKKSDSVLFCVAFSTAIRFLLLNFAKKKKLYIFDDDDEGDEEHKWRRRA